MNIDFFTLGAQIINLLILLFLLRKFLYRPVLKVLRERKALLEGEYAKADDERQKAELLHQKMQKEYAAIENVKQAELLKINEQAQELALKLSDEARSEFEKEQKQWKNKLKSEQITFEAALQKLIVQYFAKFTDEALKQMADISLNELFLQKLKQKISDFTAKQKNEFIRDFLMQKEIEITTAGELKTTQKQEFKLFLQDTFQISEGLKIKFSTDENLLCGVQIKAKEQMLEWNLAEYIAEFEKNLNTAVSEIINKD